MSVQRGIGTIIYAVIAIVILVVAVVIIVNVMSGDPPAKSLIFKSLELRKAQNPVDKADLISSIDDLVADTDNSEIKDQWERMTKCLATNCPDEAYLDMVLVTVASYESEIKESALLINIIATAKYWGDNEHLLEFSKALSIANEQITLLENRNAEKEWDEVVKCNGVCPEKNDLYFNLITTIVQ